MKNTKSKFPTFLQSQINQVSQEEIFGDWNGGPEWMVGQNPLEKLLDFQRMHCKILSNEIDC